MKTHNKGFVAPLLLALVAILLVGGGAYVYQQTKHPFVENSVVQPTSVAQTSYPQAPVQQETLPSPTENKKDETQGGLQAFELKLGDKAIYKSGFRLSLELVEIGKMKDFRNIKDLTEDEIRFFDKGPCKKSGCGDMLEENYYIIKVGNLDLDSCGERRVVLRAMGIFECPSFYNLSTDVLSSDNTKIRFTVEYIPTSFQ